MLRFRKTLVALLVCCLLLGVAGIAMAEHVHTWSAWKTIKEPSCTDSGERQRTCSCGAVENDYNNPPALGHKYGPYTLTTAPNCTTEGVETSICERCYDKQTRSVPKAPHQMTGWVLQTPATCTEDGSELNKCVTCTTQNQTRAIPHRGHTWAEWYPTTPAGCETTGVATRVCTTCGDKETKTLEKLNHNYGQWITEIPATCTTDGTVKRVCTRCGDTETKTATKLGHNYGLWSESVKATCTTAGKKSRVCSRCGDVHEEVIPALGKNQPNGHSFSSWTKVNEPTCTKEGSDTRSCSACGRTETRKVSKLPHTPDGIWVDKREASTKQMGLQVAHCKVCGAQAASRNVAPRGFRYEIPTYGYGPMAGEFPGGTTNMRVIFLDLTTDSDQRFALVTEDGWQVGNVRVTVAGGTVRVSLEKIIESNILRYRTWGMFPDVTQVRPINYDSSLPFDQAVKGPGNSCVIAVGMLTNYYQGGANEKFSDGMIAPGSGMSYGELNQKMLEASEMVTE